MKLTGTLAGLFTLAVVIGVLAMVVQSPKATVQLMQAGADSITNITYGLEGRANPSRSQ